MTLSADEVRSIDQDLRQFGMPDHRRLTIRRVSGVDVPETARLARRQSIATDAVARVTIEFLSTYEEHFTGYEPLSRILWQLAPKVPGDLMQAARRLHGLFAAKTFAIDRITQANEQAEAVRVAASRRAKLQGKTAKEIVASAEEKLQQAEAHRDAAKARIQMIEQGEHIAYQLWKKERTDTLIFSAHKGCSSAASCLLRQIPYFEGLFSERIDEARKVEFETSLGRKLDYSYVIADLDPFTKETVDFFLGYLDHPSLVARAETLDHLLELLRLADFLQYGELYHAAFALLKPLLLPKDALDMLNGTLIMGRDPLITFLCERFDECSALPEFLKCEPMEIHGLLSEVTPVDTENEDSLFNAVVHWAKHQEADLWSTLNQAKPTPLLALFRQELIDNKTRDQFLALPEVPQEATAMFATTSDLPSRLYGTISDASKSFDLTLIVPDITQKIQTGVSVGSSDFSFAGAKWRLELGPVGEFGSAEYFIGMAHEGCNGLDGREYTLDVSFGPLEQDIEGRLVAAGVEGRMGYWLPIKPQKGYADKEGRGILKMALQLDP